LQGLLWCWSVCGSPVLAVVVKILFCDKNNNYVILKLLASLRMFIILVSVTSGSVFHDVLVSQGVQQLQNYNYLFAKNT
jgi:hypothetical protein